MLKSLVLLCVLNYVYLSEATFPLLKPGQFLPSYFMRVSHSDKFVAFSAGLTHMAALHVSNNDTVPYDRVFLNLGNGYNATSGIFTSPRTGTYVFMYFSLSQNNKQLQLDLYRNNEYIVGSYAHEASDYGAISNSVILGLDEQDTVHIRAHTDDFLYGQPDEVYTTFTGFILVPDQGRSPQPTKGQGR